jgi:acylphosphatase
MPVARVRVTGTVQGVGFRWFARQLARRYDLAGWVKNRDDGSVELAIDGADADLQEFLSCVREGPPGARVDDVQSLPVDALAPLARPFTIVR